MSSTTLNGLLTLAPGVPEGIVLDALDRLTHEGPYQLLVQRYVERGEIDESRFTDPIRQGMVEWLMRRGVSVTDPAAVDSGDYDELFAVAYEYATRAADGRDDPIQASREAGAVAAWDFTVETFDELGSQGVIPENILAAGAIDYVFELGEAMGVFRLADALVLNWAAGAIDVADGPGASKLYRYYKLRDERSTVEERGMLYRRILNKGGGRVLGRMVINEPFPGLWMKLMSEVATFIDKRERAGDGLDAAAVSRTGIQSATVELQHNLTDFCTGMSHMQVRELYAQLQDALDLLRDPEVIQHFGGSRRKSLWTVIQSLARDEFGMAPNISAIRTAAVRGNDVFRWIATYDHTSTADEEFEHLVESAEAYIHARSVIGEDEPTDDFGEEEFDEDFDTEFEDDFAEFDDF
jgi:hypothetical protein